MWELGGRGWDKCHPNFIKRASFMKMIPAARGVRKGRVGGQKGSLIVT